jgi:hypothetical protein
MAWRVGAMHDDIASIRRHDAPASPKKSVAGRARGDPNPPHASVAGLIFCPGMKRSNGFICIKRQLFVWKNKKLSFIHKIYIWHHNSKADAAESG